MSRTVLLTAALALLAACGSASVPTKTVVAKAASDFGCPADQIQTTKVTDNNFTATGCGKKASYLCSGSNFMTDGMCAREGEVK